MNIILPSKFVDFTAPRQIQFLASLKRMTRRTSEILDWFARQPFATFARMGRMGGLPIAGVKPDKIEAQREARQQLHAQGQQPPVPDQGHLGPGGTIGPVPSLKV